MLFIFFAAFARGSPYDVTVDWAGPPTAISRLTPTLQVVPNAAAYRSSPIHSAVWANLASLKAEMVRLQLWLPFPGMSVAALEPPSPPGKLCGFRAGDSPDFARFTLDCGNGSTIKSVDFAVYGRSGGVCGALRAGGCAATGAAAAVEAACVGKQACTVEGSAAFMGGTAPCTSPSTAVQVTCTGDRVYTSWDFSRMDTVVQDFLDATAGARRTVFDFSTPPQWLYRTADRVGYPDDPEATTWAYEQGKDLVDATAGQLADYFARVLAWYTDGGFVDEAGVRRNSGHFFPLTVWEFLNEEEHGLSPEAYTLQYDRVVLAQRARAPRGASSLAYMGLALIQGLDVGAYMSYFLNMSNHLPGVPRPDFASFHYYAGAVLRDDVNGYEGICRDVEDWLPNVRTAINVRDALSPSTQLDMDEVGVILPNDNSNEWTGDAPGFPPIYWNAAAASFMYRFLLYAPLGLEFMGDSALAQIPNMTAARGPRWAPQFPSVSLLDWNTGAPTARFRVLQLLIQSTSPGMALRATAVAAAPASTFCASGVNLGAGRPANVSLACAPGGGVIAEVLFAAYGVLPPGSGGPPRADGGCPSALLPPPPLGGCATNASALVRAACEGKAVCALSVGDGGPLGDPCPNHVKALLVVARCSGAAGGALAGPAAPVAAVGATGAGGAERRVFIVNKSARPQTVAVEGAGGGEWAWVDEATGGGPPGAATVPTDGRLALAPFAAGVLTMP